MRILYGIQATGNGHLARAIELVPALRQFMDVDLLVSGTESSIDFPLEIKHLRHGLGYSFGTSGKVDIAKSIRNLKLGRFVRDVTMSPVRGYDLAISDFEPITAWSAKLYGIPSIALSHQASFLFKNSPRPHRRKRYAEFILKNYAPADRHIGIHFQSYHRQIHGPVIRQEVASLEPQKGDYIVVYLSAYCPTFLADLFRSIPQIQWRVFSNHVSQPYRIENVQVYPIASALWLESLANCGAALMGAGFEGPSEA
nr:hypothetical protein [Saprospiraceae bacterium]